MASPFSNSMFSLLIGKQSKDNTTNLGIMGGITGSRFADSQVLANLPIVVFDFETTGLDPKNDRIIEIGAVKFQNRREVGRYETLVDPGRILHEDITRITGLTDADLKGQPTIGDVLPNFHDFLRGCVGIAHNAEFDVGFLVQESRRIGVQCDYTVLCSLKMARVLVNSERKGLDALAAHYHLTFESRHRSIGDILVTAQVLWNMLDENPGLKAMRDFAPYREIMGVK